jgi:CubicO group peptidase (beta-lactamase class C family)
MKTPADLDELFHSVNRSNAPGLVVGVAHYGKTVYRRGFGLASIEHGVANTPHTRMRIGSASKHFTCLAALLLAEEGKLDLDASARIYLPELPALKGGPTLRQLMTHSSGYRCHLDLAFLSDGMAMQPKGAVLAAQVRQTDVNFAPGEGMIYCNGGYQLVSLAIERSSGMPLENFLRTRIFNPLGMCDTESVPSDFEIHPGLATLHVLLPDGRYRRGIFPSEEVRGCGGIISTVDDMLRWLAHLRGPKRVGSEASWNQMLTVMRLSNGLVSSYALGLMRHFYRGVEVIHHPGSVIGGTCQMLTVPSHALDIIILNNGAPEKPVELANKIIDVMLGDAVLAAPPSMAASECFKHLIGTRYHAVGSGFVVGFEALGEKLGVSILNDAPVPIRDAGDVLRLGFEEIGVGPLVLQVAELLETAAEGAAPAGLQISETGRVERFERLPAIAPTLLDAGRPLVGRYRARDLDADAEICFEEDRLELRVFGACAVSRISLEAFSATVFGWKSLDPLLPLRGVLTVEHKASPVLDAAGRREPTAATFDVVNGFRLNTGRTRHLWFERRP